MNRFHMVLLLIVSTVLAGILFVIRALVVRAESKRRKHVEIGVIRSTSTKRQERSAGSSLQAIAAVVHSGSYKTSKEGVYGQDPVIAYYSTRFVGH